MGDTAYSSAANRACLRKRKIKAVPRRGLRYVKRELIYQGTIDVASIRIWLRDPVP